MEEQARDQLGIEVGALLRHRFAAPRHLEDILDPKRPDEEGALGPSLLDLGDGLVDRGGVSHVCRRVRFDELDVQLALVAVEQRDATFSPVQNCGGAISGLRLEVVQRDLDVVMGRVRAVDVLRDAMGGKIIRPGSETLTSTTIM